MKTETNGRLSVVKRGNDLILGVPTHVVEEFEDEPDTYKEEWFSHQFEEAGYSRVRPEEVGALTDAELWSETVVRNDPGDLLAVGQVYMDNMYAIRASWTALFQDGVVVLTADPGQDGPGEPGRSPRKRVFEQVVEAFAREWIRARTQAREHGLEDESGERMVEYVNAWVAEPLHAVDVLAYTDHHQQRIGDGTFEDDAAWQGRLSYMARWCMYEDVRARATKLAYAAAIIPRDASWEYTKRVGTE